MLLAAQVFSFIYPFKIHDLNFYIIQSVETKEVFSQQSDEK